MGSEVWGSRCLNVPGRIGSGVPPSCPMARHSQLQREVLSLYKQCLRAAQGKPGFVPRVCEEFRRNAALPTSDVLRIEHLLRRGQRQLQQLRDARTTQLGVFLPPGPEPQ